jgi:hypothetical protein
MARFGPIPFLPGGRFNGYLYTSDPSGATSWANAALTVKKMNTRERERERERDGSFLHGRLLVNRIPICYLMRRLSLDF